MAQVKTGDRVRIHFTGKLDDETVFTSTYEEDGCSTDGCQEDDCDCETGPMEVIVGSDAFFSPIVDALIGMSPGQKKTVVVPAAEGFGEYDEDNLVVIGRSQFPEDLVPELDMELELEGENGESLVGAVVEVTDQEVTLDANHPLAGEDLIFDLELVEIL